MPIKTVILNTDLGNTLLVDSNKKVNVNIDNSTIIVKDGKLSVAQTATSTSKLALEIIPSKRWYTPGEAQQFTFKVTNTSADVLPAVTASVALSTVLAYAEQVLTATVISQPTSPATGKFLYSEADNEGVNYLCEITSLQPNQSVSFQLQTTAEGGVVQALLHAQVSDGNGAFLAHASSRVHVPVAHHHHQG